MRKSVLAGLTVAALVPLAAMPATAGNPRIYHTISDTYGYAVVTEQLDECLLGEVFVSSSVGTYAAQPGPVNKQGLTGVFVRVSDTCATAPEGDVSVQAGGGGGVVVLEVDGQLYDDLRDGDLNGAALQVDPRLRWAWVATAIPGSATAYTDGVPGEPYDVVVQLGASWTGVGELEHTTAMSHVLFPEEGVVNSSANDLRRSAAAEVTVTVDGLSITGSDPGVDAGGNGVLEQSKSRCIEVPRPGVEGFYPCFGFPG